MTEQNHTLVALNNLSEEPIPTKAVSNAGGTEKKMMPRAARGMQKEKKKKKTLSRKQLDYEIYMAQFSAPEKTDEYHAEVMKMPQFRMSIYPAGYKKPQTQFEEMMLPSNLSELSFNGMFATKIGGTSKKQKKTNK